MAFVTMPTLPTARTSRTSVCVTMSAKEEPVVSRRALLTGAVAAAAAAIVLPKDSLAEREYPNVGYLGGGDVIDVNNANVRVYQKLRGFYPGLAGLIVANGPYESVDELYKLPGLSPEQKAALDRSKNKLTALKPAPEYVIDRFNNGLYR